MQEERTQEERLYGKETVVLVRGELDFALKKLGFLECGLILEAKQASLVIVVLSNCSFILANTPASGGAGLN